MVVLSWLTAHGFHDVGRPWRLSLKLTYWRQAALAAITAAVDLKRTFHMDFVLLALLQRYSRRLEFMIGCGQRFPKLVPRCSAWVAHAARLGKLS